MSPGPERPEKKCRIEAGQALAWEDGLRFRREEPFACLPRSDGEAPGSGSLLVMVTMSFNCPGVEQGPGQLGRPA